MCRDRGAECSRVNVRFYLPHQCLHKTVHTNQARMCDNDGPCCSGTRTHIGCSVVDQATGFCKGVRDTHAHSRCLRCMIQLIARQQQKQSRSTAGSALRVDSSDNPESAARRATRAATKLPRRSERIQPGEGANTLPRLSPYEGCSDPDSFPDLGLFLTFELASLGEPRLTTQPRCFLFLS